jgi:hypothetical protein
MKLVKEQSIYVKFYFKVRKTAAGPTTHCMKLTSSQTMTYRWFKGFQDGRNSTYDD